MLSNTELIEALKFSFPEHNGLQERSIDTTSKIIEAAIEAFSERGYNDSSTHDIAQRAGVNQGLITYHFKSKDALWRTAMDNLFGELRNALAVRMHELREVDVRIYLKLIIREFVRWNAGNQALLRILIEEGKESGERIKWLTLRHIKPVYDAVTDLLRTGQESGAIRQGAIENIYYHFVASSLVFCLEDEVEISTGINPKSPQFVEQHADCLIDMIFTDSSRGHPLPDQPAGAATKGIPD